MTTAVLETGDDLAQVGEHPGDAPEVDAGLAGMQELRGVIGVEALGGGHRLGLPVRVIVERQAHRSLREPLRLDDRAGPGANRTRCDDDVGPLDSGARRRDGAELDRRVGRPHFGAVARGAVEMDVVGPHGLQRRDDRRDRLEVGAGLHAAPQDAERGGAGPRQPLRRYGARRPGAHRGDPGRVHHRLRQAGLRVVEDQQAGDVRQPAPQIFGEAADPLDARRAQGADERRHRVDEVVAARRSGVDARLRRHLDAPEPLLAEGNLEAVDDRGHRDGGRLDVGAR